MKQYFKVTTNGATTHIPFNKVVKMWESDDKFFIVPDKGDNEKVLKNQAILFLEWLNAKEFI